ncbi:MAG TPA: hypothetical protein VFV81_07120, partial [Verrucomicrobiae bacterium]|nr:hypothetical protein [Verrucomicrobiae bacterium]
GVNVQLNGEEQPDGQMSTDRNGAFHFRVCAGEIRLFAYSTAGSGSAQATVEAGDTNIVLTLESGSGSRSTPRAVSLKGSPLPDLAGVNLPTAMSNRPVLLCLFDANQRPSRHVLQQLQAQADLLKNIDVYGVQAAVIREDVFSEWKSNSAVSFPVGRVTGKSAATKWAAAPVLPWLILANRDHRVVAEGFSADDLPAEIARIAD